MPIKKYKTPNGQIVSESDLKAKYGNRFSELIKNNTFSEVNESVYKAPNGKYATESQLKEKYGDRFDELTKNNTFVLDEPLKKKENLQSTVQEPNVESPTKAVEQPISLATSKPESYDLKTQAKTQDFSEPFTVEKQGDLPKKEKDEASYSAEVWRSLQKGSTRLGRNIAATPEFIYEFFAYPQNKIAEKYGIDILATDAEKLKDNIGVQNTIKDYYAGKTKELEQQSLELDRKYEGGITDNIKNGNIKDAFRLLGSSLAESLPSTLGIMVGGAYAKAPELLAGISTVFGAGENEEAKENSPELETSTRTFTSWGKGLSEGVFSTIGTARIGVAAKEIIAKEGIENGGKLLKENLIDIYTQLLKKAPIPTAMIGEGVEEAATQITQNAIDKYSAGNDEVNLMDNVSDAFIMGVGGGGVFGVALEGLKKVSGSGTSKTDIEAVEPLLEKRESIVNELEQQVKDGDVTKEWASKTIENFDQIKEQLKAVPNDYNSEEKAKAVELLKEKSAIEKEIDGKDESLVTAKKERVNAIKEELKGIKTPQDTQEGTKPIENAEIVPEKVEKPIEVAQNDIKANEKSDLQTEIENQLAKAENKESNDLEDLEIPFLKNYNTKTKIEELSSFSNYKRNDHVFINKLLRDGKDISFENVKKEKPNYPDSSIQDVVDDFNIMDKSTNESKITAKDRSIKLHRNIFNNGKDINNVSDITNLEVGDVLTDKSLISTTIDTDLIDTNRNATNINGDNFVTATIEIEIGKGESVNGTYVFGVEKEFILPRNTSLKIISKDTNDKGQVTLRASVVPNESQKNQIAPIKENKDENSPPNDITPNRNIQLGTDSNQKQGQDKNIQQAVEPKSDKNDVEVKKVKSVKNATYDVSFDANGNVTKIVSPKDGREIPKFIERKLKPTKANLKANPKGVKLVLNGNYAKIESDALGTITNNMANDERKAKVQNALDKFTPTDEYSHALQFFAQGGAVSLESAKKETRLSAKEVKWASRSKNKYKKDSELKTIEGTAEDIVANSQQDLDLQEVRNALIDLISNKEGANNVENEVVGIVESEEIAQKEEELFAYLGGLSEKDLSLYESIKAEDDYISELTYNQKVEYYEQEYGKKDTENDGKREGENPSVQERDGEKKPTRKERVAERVKISNAKIDDWANALKDVDNIFGIPIKVKNIDDINTDGISQNALIDMIANIVKQAVEAGINIDEAIKKTIEHFQKTIDFEINPDDIKAKLDSEKPKVEKKVIEKEVEKEEVEKPIVNKVENIDKTKIENFRDKIKALPHSGIFSQYLSGETIIEAEGINRKDLRNDQSIEVFLLDEAGNHGKETIEMAKELFGETYVEKTLQYLSEANLQPHEKAVIYVSLENEMHIRVTENPKSVGEKKLQDLVRAKSQDHLSSSSRSINSGKLRKIMKNGYIPDPITNQMYSPEQLEDKGKIQKAIEANMDAINNEAESQENEPDFEIKPPKTIRSAKVVKLEIAETLKKMRADLLRVAKGDMAMASIPYAAQLKAATPHIIKLSKLLAELGGMKTRAIINEIHSQIKEIFPDINKQDVSDVLKTQNTPKQKVKVDNKAREAKEFVKQALIEQGFGREINVTVNEKDAQGNNILDENGRNKKVKQKRNVLDWKKLAGEAGSIENIQNNVESVLKDKGYTDVEIQNMSKEFKAEYNDLRASVIEKSLNELKRRNEVRKKIDIKSSAKRLAEIYNYGLFDEDANEFSELINSALGFNDFDNASFKELEVLAKSLANLYSTGYSEIELQSALASINKQIERVISKASYLQSSNNFKAASITDEYINLSTRMKLVSVAQALQNPSSGYVQRGATKLAYSFSGTDNKQLIDQRSKVAIDHVANIVLNGGLAYGDTSSLLVNESMIENTLNGATESKALHAVISNYMGKPFLEGFDTLHKVNSTEKYFVHNLIMVLTNPTNPNRMSKSDALNFVTERLTGQSFEDAKVKAREVTDKINKDAGKKVLKDNEIAINILAQGIMKSTLLVGNKLTQEQIEASYKAAYKGAGGDFGHVPNNPLSKMVSGYNSRVERELQAAQKEKNWRKATRKKAERIVSRNLLNVFASGGTNWFILGTEYTPLGLLSLWEKSGKRGKIDLTTTQGMKNLEEVMYRDLEYKSTAARVLIGSTVNILIAATAIASGIDDDLDDWLKRNAWAKKYFYMLAPSGLIALMAYKDNDLGGFINKMVNSKNQMFDVNYRAAKAIKDALSDKDNKWAATGMLLGNYLSFPAPIRLFQQIKEVYKGASGKEVKPKSYKSSSFLNGFFMEGLLEYSGLRPGESQDDIEFAKRMKDNATPSVKKTIEEKNISKEKILQKVEADRAYAKEYNLRHPDNQIEVVLPKSLQKKAPKNPNGQGRERRDNRPKRGQ